MDNSIFTEFLTLLQNNNDVKTIQQQKQIPDEDMHKVAQEVVPKIAEQVKSSPQTLGDLLRIFTEKKNDPGSMLNSEQGFDQQTVKNDGNEILNTIFGSGNQTTQVASEVSQKTGVSIEDICSMLPMLATMATKLLGNKADSLTSANTNTETTNETPQSPFEQILGFLDDNKDGSITDDLGRMGQKIMGNLFNQEHKKEG